MKTERNEVLRGILFAVGIKMGFDAQGKAVYMRTRLFSPRKGVVTAKNANLKLTAGIKTPFAGEKIILYLLLTKKNDQKKWARAHKSG